MLRPSTLPLTVKKTESFVVSCVSRKIRKNGSLSVGVKEPASV